MSRILSLIAMLAVGLPLLAADEATYKIKILNAPAEGKSVKTTESAKISSATKILDDNGAAVKDDKEEKTIKIAYTQKTIEGGEKRSKKYSRNFSKAEETVDGATEKYGYSGRTVLYTLDKGEYKVEADGKPELDDKSSADLTKEANKDPDGTRRDGLLPKNAVKVGEKWKLEPKAIANLLKDLQVVEAGAKGTGKLTKVYKKDGKQFGVMEFEMTGTGKAGGADGKADVSLTVDVPIDGSSSAGKATSKLTYAINQTVEQNGMKFKVDAKVVINGVSESEDVAEKK